MMLAGFGKTNFNRAPLKRICLLNPEVMREDTDPHFEFNYIDIGNVSMGLGVTGTELQRFIAAPSRARRIVREGDVLVSTVRTYLRAVAVVKAQHDGAVASTGFAVLRAKPGIDGDYLAFAVHSEDFVSRVVVSSVGVSYPAINPSTLAGLKIPLPDLASQRAISAFLAAETARVDALIERKIKFVERLKERRDGLFERLLKDYGEVAAAAVPSAPWVGSFPSHWRLMKLSYLLTTNPCYGVLKPDDYSKDDGIPLIRIKDINQSGNLITDGMVKISPQQSLEYKRTLIDDGDVILSVVGTIGKAFVADAGHVGYNLSRALARIRPSAELDAEFLRLIFGTRWFSEYVEIMTLGAAQKVLNMETLSAWRFPVPDVVEQKAFSHAMNCADGQVAQLSAKILNSIDALREFRSALITAAVTGQIDPAEWRRRGEGDRRLDAIAAESGA